MSDDIQKALELANNEVEKWDKSGKGGIFVEPKAVVLARAYAELAREVATLRADKERLDWLESEPPQLGNIEPAGAFPDGKWTIWRGDGEYGSFRGDTLRSALDSARNTR